ncbi:MAG: thiol:disulfide interchange protein [Alphaproteobacteria bacterium RIFCSPHIGHO2_12_FULL_63_12]|nr:MAG: thiol:disulfide interchange protein [Alphaproteobacteria bacterium RIFCSPHIGHO2_12_FULL_63_12]
MKRLILLAPLTLFVVLGGYFAIGLTRDPARIPSVLIDRPLPEFDLPPIEGFEKGFASDDLRGEVALINVFGSWCESCVIEHPMLMEIAANEDVLIAGLDWKDPNGGGARWLEKNGNPYALVGDDAQGRTAIDLGVTGAPETFVVDRSGRIRYKHIGPITPQVWRETLKPLVEKLKEEGEASRG